VIDFIAGNGAAFDGGMGTDDGGGPGQQLILGFEDQLVGAKAGDEKQIEVTFPRTIRPKTRSQPRPSRLRSSQ
jgi:trigger factor